MMVERNGMSVDLEPHFYDRTGDEITCAPSDDCTVKRSNEHNPHMPGNIPRAHWWLKNKADWWKAQAPIKVKWFKNGRVIDCRTVDDPTKRYD